MLVTLLPSVDIDISRNHMMVTLLSSVDITRWQHCHPQEISHDGDTAIISRYHMMLTLLSSVDIT